MPAPSDTKSTTQEVTLSPNAPPSIDPDDELTDDVEMSLFDHLEELRMRIFYSLGAVVVGIIICFAEVRPIVRFLETPAQGLNLHFQQTGVGDFFWASIKVSGYSGIVIAAPFILYQVARFTLPGLTRRERRLLAPAVITSSFLFILGLIFAHQVLAPPMLNFFTSYGQDVAELNPKIDEYLTDIISLMLATGLTFQIPIFQFLLGALKIVSAKQMISGWRYVVLGAMILGAVLTPSVDPLTQSLLGGSVIILYFSGIGLVSLVNR